MSNQNCGWKRETTVCHSWISKDGDLAAWLERTNQAEWRYEISWVQYESGVSHSPDKYAHALENKNHRSKWQDRKQQVVFESERGK